MTGKHVPDVEGALFAKGKKVQNSHQHLYSGSNQKHAEGEQLNTSKPTCYRCRKVGHMKSNCRAKIVCKRCDKPGHIKPDCHVKLVESEDNAAHEAKEANAPKWEKCLSVEVINRPDNIASIIHQIDLNVDAASCIDYEKEWIVDSGCTHHATGDDKLLYDVRPYLRKRVIVTTDNSLHPVMQEGDYKADNSNGEDLILEDVYQVPGLKKNLASVSQITSTGKFVLFGPNEVRILCNLRSIDVDVLFNGRKKNSLYVLSATKAYVGKTSQNTNAPLWHARLGHVGYQLLQQISTNRLLKGVPLFKTVHSNRVGEGCQYGKSHCLPFHKSMNRSSSMFQLVHSDVMGPKRTASYSGFRYMVIDDFSQYSWVYFLDNKNEAIYHFMLFKLMVENEYKSVTKCLRTDNGGEFLSHGFSNFCEEHSIKCQIMCPSTPQ